MKYLLDTNAAGSIATETPQELLISRIGEAGDEIVLCAHVLLELRDSAHSDKKGKRGRICMAIYDGFRERFEVLPFDESASIDAADLYWRCRKRGETRKWFDCMIASVARVNGLTVVTHDRDFLALEVPVEDWMEPDKKLRARARA